MKTEPRRAAWLLMVGVPPDEEPAAASLHEALSALPGWTATPPAGPYRTRSSRGVKAPEIEAE